MALPALTKQEHAQGSQEIESTAISHKSSKRTIFGILEHVLHRTAISRISLLPTVKAASSVQRVEDDAANSSSSSSSSRDGDVTNSDSDYFVAKVTDDAESETGWDRLREAFFANSEDGQSRESYEVMMMFLLGGMLGFVYGGFPASRFARERYIQQSQASIYHSKLEATGSSYNAASRGMIRYGWRWGWRTALLAGGYHGISTAMAVYRDKQDLLCYSVAGVSTGILYRMSLGLRGMVGGAAIGAALGIPCGAVLLAVQQVRGESSIAKCRRLRAEKRAEKAQELALRLQVTPQMMQLMEESIGKSEKLLRDKEEAQTQSSQPS